MIMLNIVFNFKVVQVFIFKVLEQINLHLISYFKCYICVTQGGTSADRGVWEIWTNVW